MVSKAIIAGVLVVLALIVSAVYYVATIYSSPSASQTPFTSTATNGVSISETVSEQVQTTSVTAQVSSVIADEYSNIMQEELDNISTNQTTSASQTQDSIANDMSQFYYA